MGRDPEDALFGMFVISTLELSIVYVSIKLEDSSFTRSKEMKQDPAFKKKGYLGWLGSVKVIGSLNVQ